MKKILLLNQGFTDNIGDIAIQRCLENYFTGYNYNVSTLPFWSESLIFSKNKLIQKLFIKLFWFNSTMMNFFNSIYIDNLLKNNNYDVIIIGGGELLSQNRGFISSIDVWSKYANVYNIPIYLIGVSGDCDMPDSYIKKNKVAFYRFKKILVRDSLTQIMLEKKYNIKSELFPDVVFSYNLLMNEAKNMDKDNILICVPINYNCIIHSKLNVSTKEEYFTLMINEIKKISSLKKVLIVSSTEEDVKISKEFYEYVITHKLKVDFKYIGYMNLDDYVNLTKRTKYILSGRMHPMIIGKINENKIIPIKFKGKLVCFSKEYAKDINIVNVEKEALNSMCKLKYYIENN